MGLLTKARRRYLVQSEADADVKVEDVGPTSSDTSGSLKLCSGARTLGNVGAR